MSQANYPTEAEASAILTDRGITVPSNLAQIVAGVIGDWEKRTGYKPFLGATTPVTVAFDSPYKVRDFVLDLNGGFWAVTSVYTGVSAYSAGSELTEGEDYDLLPLDATANERGWNQIRFRNHPGFGAGSVEITGKRGYAEELPDDVFQAIMDEICRKAEKSASGSSSNIKSVKQGGVTVQYDESASFWEGAAETFKSLVTSYVNI